MADKTKSRTIQLEELAARVARLERRFKSGGTYSSGDGGGDDSQRFCSLPQVPERTFAADVSLERARLIRLFAKTWVNGTRLRYYFYDRGPYAGSNDQKEFVREGFEIWRNVGLGISFQEVTDISEAEVRVSFVANNRAWSYVGRDVIDVPGQHEPTMNLGWDLNDDPRGVDVAVHEIGHTLAFPHEHQNPFAGIVWDEDAVYQYFGGPPNNWDRETTYWNVLRKLAASEVAGSAWDPDSIMHYAFPAGLIHRPEQYRGGLTPDRGLSQVDIEQVRRFYPPLDPHGDTELKPFRSESLNLAPAEQKNFTINPPATRDYTIQTFGGSDTVMVLFEDRDGDLRYVKGDDDSGTSLNARIRVRLYQGRKYVLRIRLYLNYATGETAVMMW